MRTNEQGQGSRWRAVLVDAMSYYAKDGASMGLAGMAEHANYLEDALAAAQAALKDAVWRLKWAFDEHRTGGYGDLKDDAFCRCDWCKNYRDARHDYAAALTPTEAKEAK